MSDYISREAATADSDRNKIKTPFARIVVEGTPGKPYYNIWYFDPVDGECHIGFGSYCLGNVFNWLAEEFEVTEPRADVRLVRNGQWISLTDCSNAGVYCSICHKKVYKEDYAWCNRKNKVRSTYCPNCGSKMDLEDETDAIDRAIEILDPEHREHYDGMDEVNEACRMGMEALERARWISFSERKEA